MTKKEWTIIGVLGATVVVVLACLGCLMLTMVTSPPRQAERVAVSDLPSVTPAQLPTQLSATQVKPTTPPQPTQVSAAQVKPTIPPPPTPRPIEPQPTLTFDNIVSTAKQLTEIKRNDYYKSLIGKSIHWTGKVADVSDSGEVRVRIVNTISYDVVLQAVPKTTYAGLNLNDAIEFDGTITEVNDMFGSGLPKITVKSTAVKSQ